MNNGPEPEEGSWVIASTELCPSRCYFQRRGDYWVDTHGCREVWSDLVEPIDALEPKDVP